MKAKVKEIENIIPSITGLVTTAVLNTKVENVEYELSDINNLAIKADLNTKNTEIKNKITGKRYFIDTQQISKDKF